MERNGSTTGQGSSRPRADELAELLAAVQQLVIPFVKAADNESMQKASGQHEASDGTTLVKQLSPAELAPLLNLDISPGGGGQDGLLDMVDRILQYSVNTWDAGFMDKLYASTTPVGVVADLLLSILNTNVHVYQVSPALTLIEKHTTQAIARVLGFNGEHAGGISQPGGSAANQTGLVIARNALFPHTKTEGLGSARYVLFTSAHGHYSLEKAAQMFGFGSSNVRSVPVNSLGQMRVDALQEMVSQSKSAGEVPFFVNATAGTTVLGSYDPLDEIAAVCQREKMWLHVDGSWGASVAFNDELKVSRLKGMELADSVSISPHKMLGVPVTTSFLIAKDLRQVWAAMTLPASYLFHTTTAAASSPATSLFDLADLTPQCGRRGDSLKMYLSWLYYGTTHYSSALAHAFSLAHTLTSKLAAHPDAVLVMDKLTKNNNNNNNTSSPSAPPCLQVCFWWAKGGVLSSDREVTSRTTEKMAEMLVGKGWMVDYAELPEDTEESGWGKFFRVVVNSRMELGVLDGFVKALESVAAELEL